MLLLGEPFVCAGRRCVGYIRKKEGLKLSSEMSLTILTRVLFQNSFIYCDFSFHCEVAFLNSEKLETFLLFKN